MAINQLSWITHVKLIFTSLKTAYLHVRFILPGLRRFPASSVKWSVFKQEKKQPCIVHFEMNENERTNHWYWKPPLAYFCHRMQRGRSAFGVQLGVLHVRRNIR